MSLNPQEPQEPSSLITPEQQFPAPSVPEPPVKKTRSRKKAEVQSTATTAEQGSTSQADPSIEPVPPKRGRRKKSTESGTQDGEMHCRE